MTEIMSQHGEWLSLIEVSGPFLAEPVLKDAFPAGLQKLDPMKKKQFRQTYEEWRESVDSNDELQSELHQQWIEWVLKQGLEWDEDDEGEELETGEQIDDSIQLDLPEHQLTLKPSYVLYGSDKEKPYLLVNHYPADTNLNDVLAGDGWSTSPAERMSHLCRKVGTRLGLITNGEQWMLVDAPEGGVSSYASWYARLWSQEPITLIAFFELLNIRTVFNGFGLNASKLTDLLDESIKHQDEVTETLGAQVQRAVEVLVQSLDRINNDSNGELLEGIEPPELYEAGLTFMMRLVFLLCAEERGLLLLGDETYTANYALSTLRMKLREEAGLHGEEVLSYRTNAWSRLLALFRAVYGGIDHESLRMPALGGSLFDPDRFPFLEGRSKGSNWKNEEARPLPIDNRTVLLFLDAIQLYQGRTLSYRALDVEQIGYVYEGLLERTVIRAQDVTLELDATQKSKKPWVLLVDLDAAKLNGEGAVGKLLAERTGSSMSRVKNDLEREVNEADSEALLLACLNDTALRSRIKPYTHFLKKDAWGNPMIYPKGAFMVATGTDRRETGTHYTPKSLTEAIVLETLEPIVYVGPSVGADRSDWKLKSPAELLALKICDPAMGSGAFLVQVCRYLSERLCEAWALVEKAGQSITMEGRAVGSSAERELLPQYAEERQIIARRLIAEHCLYGVDVNPLAVELAKLAIWLVTLSKGRPFGFLDHNLKMGNSLLGIIDLDQLNYLAMQPKGMSGGGGTGRQLFAQGIEAAVKEALALREDLRNRPVRDIHDIEVMAHLNVQAQKVLAMPELIADALIGEALVLAANPVNLNSALTRLSITAGEVLESQHGSAISLEQSTKNLLSKDMDDGKPRTPFHWPLAFPEVFCAKTNGFDAIIGNVPFLGGSRITGAMGTVFRNYLAQFVANGRAGKSDLAAYFFLQAFRLLDKSGTFGLLATNTIAEGDTRYVGLDALLEEQQAVVYSAFPSEPWPGKAAVVTSRVHIVKGLWNGDVRINGRKVPFVSSLLTDREEWAVKPLKANDNQSFLGSYVHGIGYTMEESKARELLGRDSNNRDILFPYLGGRDLNTNPDQKASRWVINFFDWPEEKAKKYPEAYEIVRREVKPVRDKLKRAAYRERWWQYAEKQASLYHALGRGTSFEAQPAKLARIDIPIERVIVNSKVGKYFNPSFVPTDQVFQDKVVVLLLISFSELALMNSSIIQEWVWKYSGRMKMDLSFTPKEAYRTLPFPEPRTSPLLEKLGEHYDSIRLRYREENHCGITSIYNMFHDPECNDSLIVNLRKTQKEIDQAVAEAYSWNDIAFDHDFYELEYLPEDSRLRYTISREARIEVIYRLAMLNKQRSEQERAGILKTTRSTARKYVNKPGRDFELDKVAEPKPQMDIFSKDEQ